MPYYYVRSMEPLCPSKKICPTAEDCIERIKEIQRKTQEFRDKLWEEELIENKINRQVSFQEMDKHIFITHVKDENWKKRFRLFKNSDFKDPFERKICYIIAKEEQEKKINV